MKSLCCLWLVTASVAFGVEIGATEPEVIAEKGAPKTVVAAGTRRVLQYPDMSVVLKNGHVTTLRFADGSVQTATSTTVPAVAAPAGSQQEFDAAIARVKEIINQPPPSQKDDFGIPVIVMKNAWTSWFHGEPVKPDFNTVDVRQTQQLPYAGHPFITSDTTLGTIYPGSGLEFNPVLGYFYADRTHPKKRLTLEEMNEINRLFRIIGRDEQLLGVQAR